MAKEFFGIDLGTTYSCIALVDSDKIVTVIPNSTGQLTTPSVVSFDDDGNLLVGRAAKQQLGNRPENTVAFIKREMSNKDFTRTIQGRNYDPVEISSFILKAIVDEANRKRADEEGADPIRDVVITVPAYFGDMEIKRTKEAGLRAGLNVLQLIAEPTAATLSYGRKQQANKTIMVYDLGGGTFDVSILEIKNGIMNTLSTSGDHKLGGVDWDREIVDFALEKIGASFEQLSHREQGMMMLAAEDCKQVLSAQDKSTMTFSYKGIQNVDITKEEFELRAERLMGRTMLLVEEALSLAGLSISQIDEILLVGGSSRMPMVKAFVENKMHKVPKLIDPDMAVAKGAALTALQTETYDPKGLMLGKDKGSRAYGMSAFNRDTGRDMVFNLIMRNDDKEIHKEINDFSTLNDGQTALDFHFYESETPEEIYDIDPDLEIKGREDSISWGFPVPSGTPIKIIVDRDKDGAVTVYAECQGAKGKFQIVTPGCNTLSR